MVHNGTLLDRLEDWGRDSAGMLRRRIRGTTVLWVIAIGAIAAVLVFEAAVRLLR